MKANRNSSWFDKRKKIIFTVNGKVPWIVIYCWLNIHGTFPFHRRFFRVKRVLLIVKMLFTIRKIVILINVQWKVVLGNQKWYFYMALLWKPPFLDPLFLSSIVWCPFAIHYCCVLLYTCVQVLTSTSPFPLFWEKMRYLFVDIWWCFLWKELTSDSGH